MHYPQTYKNIPPIPALSLKPNPAKGGLKPAFDKFPYKIKKAALAKRRKAV